MNEVYETLETEIHNGLSWEKEEQGLHQALSKDTKIDQLKKEFDSLAPVQAKKIDYERKIAALTLEMEILEKKEAALRKSYKETPDPKKKSELDEEIDSLVDKINEARDSKNLLSTEIFEALNLLEGSELRRELENLSPQ